ncbi:LexA family protein [Comamonas sp.]|uniref:LexA family protein n=1 Tax=Comamonas sp. TaxID=34028 RepID=UPI003D0A12F5
MHSILQPLNLDASPMVLPVAGSSVRAGFPSPADDWSQERIDLTKLLIPHPACTFLVKSGGLSMKDAGIDDGDLLVVDRYMKPEHKSIVVAVLDNDFTVKYLFKRGGRIKLQAANPTFPDISIGDEQTLEIWGVVTCSIKRFVKV